LISSRRTVHALVLTIANTLAFCLLLGWSAHAAAQTVDDVQAPQRVLGSSNTLANHDLVNPGPEDATHVRYTLEPMPPIKPAQLKFTAFWMEPHMAVPNTVPNREDGSTTTRLTWEADPDKPIVAGTMTHIGYSVGANVADCLASVSGGAIQFLIGEDPIADVDTANIDWCGPPTTPDQEELSRALMDGRGDPITAWVSMAAGTPVTVTARVGATDDDLLPEDMLPLLTEDTFDTTFTRFTQDLDPEMLDARGRVELHTFSEDVTNDVEWLGIAMEVQRVGQTGPLVDRSYFAWKVDDPDEHPPVRDTPPAPTATNTPQPTPTTTNPPGTPTATPTSMPVPPTDTPTPSPTDLPNIVPQACPNIESRVPAAILGAALANPQNINGYGHRCFPSQPVSPFNPLRQTLDLQNPNRPYHPIFNPLIFTCGC
jgi:hypothetical protein